MSAEEEAGTVGILRAWDRAPDGVGGEMMHSRMLAALTDILEREGLAAHGCLTQKALDLCERVNERTKKAREKRVKKSDGEAPAVLPEPAPSSPLAQALDLLRRTRAVLHKLDPAHELLRAEIDALLAGAPVVESRRPTEDVKATLLSAVRTAHDGEQGRRDHLGRIVREEWIKWAREQPSPKPSWLVPWEGLSEPDKEVDRRIGARLYSIGVLSTAGEPQIAPTAYHPEIEAAIDGVVGAAKGVGPSAFERAVTRLLGMLSKHREPPRLPLSPALSAAINRVTEAAPSENDVVPVASPRIVDSNATTARGEATGTTRAPLTEAQALVVALQTTGASGELVGEAQALLARVRAASRGAIPPGEWQCASCHARETETHRAWCEIEGKAGTIATRTHEPSSPTCGLDQDALRRRAQIRPRFGLPRLSRCPDHGRWPVTAAAVLALIADVYDVPAARVTLDTELRELAGDSLARVLLAVEIDKLVPVPMGEEERWTTAGDVVRWVEGRSA